MLKKMLDELMLSGIHVMVNGHMYVVCKTKSGFVYHGELYVDENLMLHTSGDHIEEDRDAINKLLEVL